MGETGVWPTYQQAEQDAIDFQREGASAAAQGIGKFFSNWWNAATDNSRKEAEYAGRAADKFLPEETVKKRPVKLPKTDSIGTPIEGDYADSMMEASTPGYTPPIVPVDSYGTPITGDYADSEMEAKASGYVPPDAATGGRHVFYPQDSYDQEYVDRWMDAAFNEMIKEGGKYYGKYQNIYDMLSSGDYDAWKDWLSYGDGTIGSQLFWQTYGDQYADILGSDISKLWSAESGWNDELLRKIYDAEIAANAGQYANIFGGNDYQAMMDLIRSAQYFGDDWIDYMRRHGFGNAWEGYDSTKSGFEDWIAETYGGNKEAGEAAYAAATDKLAHMLFGDNMYGKDFDPIAGRLDWESVVNDEDVYTPGYSDKWKDDGWWPNWQQGTMSTTGDDSDESEFSILDIFGSDVGNELRSIINAVGANRK